SAQLRCDLGEALSRFATPLMVLADRERLQQILLNLLTNAIKFTPAGGSIAISAEPVPDSPLARIEIRDNGVGIPEGRLEEVFEPFVQLATKLSSRQDGIGIGLTISREFARGMGGDLTVARGRAEGAAFTLTLPLA
ncbi:MAG TPA: ATP-binding protein, partial [Gemmatimonadaceae bacterium]|nr:ATP-binding protein [Gemmatimonadaceae bacterium]